MNPYSQTNLIDRARDILKDANRDYTPDQIDSIVRVLCDLAEVEGA